MRLIQEAGFAGVCIEGDWPDTFALHSYVTGAADPSQTLDDAFEPLKSRFPVWMWRNEPTREFIRAMRERNAPLPEDSRAAVFGLDVYSMHASMAAVKAYLKKVDPPAAEAVGALDKLEAFASFNGPDFYDLPRNKGTVTLQRQSWTPPEAFAFGEAELKPLRAGEALPWQVVG